jgi:hypothetical protein
VSRTDDGAIHSRIIAARATDKIAGASNPTFVTITFELLLGALNRTLPVARAEFATGLVVARALVRATVTSPAWVTCALAIGASPVVGTVEWALRLLTELTLEFVVALTIDLLVDTDSRNFALSISRTRRGHAVHITGWFATWRFTLVSSESVVAFAFPRGDVAGTTALTKIRANHFVTFRACVEHVTNTCAVIAEAVPRASARVGIPGIFSC